MSTHNWLLYGVGDIGKGATMQLNELLDRLQSIAKGIGADHALALQLWNSGIHEARILASYIADPQQMSEAQIEKWVADFDSWDV